MGFNLLRGIHPDHLGLAEDVLSVLDNVTAFLLLDVGTEALQWPFFGIKVESSKS